MEKIAQNSLFFSFFLILFFQSCNRNDAYAAKSKSLDSLSGAINALVKEASKNDTIILNKAILRFNHYKQFIQQTIKDTVTKTEADFIQQFYSSGKQLENFSVNQKLIKARTVLINTQLEKLKRDLKNDLLPEEKLIEYTSIETKEAGILIEASNTQQQIFYSSLQEFKTALKGVEELIKLRNNGLLPTVVKDTLSL